MRISISIFALIALMTATVLVAGSDEAYASSGHIHKAHALTHDHASHSPFHQHTGHMQAEKQGQSLHCILNGHSPDKPCPHTHVQQDVGSKAQLHLNTECGGQTSPNGTSVVQTDGSFVAIAPTQSDAIFTGPEHFEVTPSLISRSLSGIAPPPKRALLS